MMFDRRRIFLIGSAASYAVIAALWAGFSYSTSILSNPADNSTSISADKEMLLVLAAVPLLWMVLAWMQRGEASPSSPREPAFRFDVSWAPIAALGAAVIAVLLIANVAYRSQAEAIRRDALFQLEAVAKLEVDAIARWLDERRGDADQFARNPAQRDVLARWIETRQPEDAEILEDSLNVVRGSQDHNAVALVDREGRLLIGDEAARSDASEFLTAVNRAATGTAVQMLDLHRRADGSIHLGFLAPIYDQQMARGEPLAIAVVDVTPAGWLDPQLASWPLTSKTGEFILVRRQGDELVSLIGTRTQPNSALIFTIPLTRTELPAVRHVLFGDATSDSMDWRGIRVLAAMATVGPSSWTLVAKMEASEAFAALNGLAIGAGLSTALALAICLGLAFLLWQRQRLDMAYREIEQRRKVRVAEERFRATFEQAAVAIAHVTLDGRWMWFNRQFAAVVGYDHAALEQMSVADVLHPDERAEVAQSLEFLTRGEIDRLVSERRIVRSDGEVLWVSITASLVRDAPIASSYVVAMIEDVSARRAAETALRASEERFELAMRGANDGLWDWNVAASEIYFSPRWASMLGYEPDEIACTFEAWMELIHPDEVAAVRVQVAEVLDGWTESFAGEFGMRAKDGSWRAILSRGFALRDEAGRAIRLIGTHTDITDRKRVEADLRRAAAVFGNTHEGVVITDPQGRVIDINPAFSRITGWEREAVIGNSPRLLNSGRHDATFYADMWRSIGEEGHWQGEIWNRRKSGEIYPEWLTISAVRDDAGTVVNYVGTFIDIGALKQSEARLTHLAHHDSLTDLPNRVLLLEELDRAIEAASACGGMGAVLFLDLDRFKNVNDSLGHAAGDQLLWLVSRRLRDLLPEGAMLARLGGDEFVCLIRDVGQHEQASALARRLIDDLNRSFVLSGGQEIFISASIGISLFPNDGAVANELIQHADAALYEAKGAGRSTHRFYEVLLTTAASIRLETEAGLRRALARDEFELHYQPLVTTVDGRVRGVEALLRWRDPVRGLIAPDQFIPIAEETGLIIAIGEWVLKTACRQMHEWLEAGLGLQTMAVNLSPREFQRPDIVRRITTVLEETGMSAKHLELEITEGALMDQGEEAEKRLAALKALGLRLSIDDFGTGWSSLAYLRRLPIDKLKIDRSFVRDMPGDPTAVEIASAIVSLAGNLGLEVLAEGVETREQFESLVQLGCDVVQGYLFAHPLPAADLPLFLGRPGRDHGSMYRLTAAATARQVPRANS